MCCYLYTNKHTSTWDKLSIVVLTCVRFPRKHVLCIRNKNFHVRKLLMLDKFSSNKFSCSKSGTKIYPRRKRANYSIYQLLVISLGLHVYLRKVIMMEEIDCTSHWVTLLLALWWEYGEDYRVSYICCIYKNCNKLTQKAVVPTISVRLVYTISSYPP